jgi:hypothetical protein
MSPLYVTCMSLLLVSHFPYAFWGVGFFFFTYGSFRHLVGLLGRGISPALRPLPTHRKTQHRQTQTHIHAPSKIRTCDPNVRAAEDSTCLRSRGHWDRHMHVSPFLIRPSHCIWWGIQNMRLRIMQCVQTGSGAHPASYPMGNRGSFPGGKAAGAWSWPLTSI